MKIYSLAFFLFLSLTASNCKSQKTGYVVSKDGTQIFYRSYGAGNPLLIINGGPGMNSDGFQGLATMLSDSFYTITYDQRGTGKSVLRVSDASTITMEKMIEDIEALRQHLNIDQWSILGHSFGGMLASYYATKFPGMINKMVLSSSGGIDLDLLNYVQTSINSKLSSANTDSLRYWTEKINSGDTSYAVRYERGKHLAPAYVVDKKHVPVIADRLTQSNLNINQLMWSNMRSIGFDCADGLRRFNRPVLIIQGKQDIIKEDTAETAHKVLKNSKVILMDHCSHYGWLDNPEVYFSEVYSFLTPAQ